MILPLVLLFCACSSNAPVEEPPFGEHSDTDVLFALYRETAADLLEALNSSSPKELLPALFSEEAKGRIGDMDYQLNALLAEIEGKPTSCVLHKPFSNYSRTIIDSFEKTYTLLLTTDRRSYYIMVTEYFQLEQRDEKEGIRLMCVVDAENWKTNARFEVSSDELQELAMAPLYYEINEEYNKCNFSGIYVFDKKHTKAFCDFTNYNKSGLDFVYEEWAED